MLITFPSPPSVHIPCKKWIPINYMSSEDTNDDLDFNYLENYETN